jgi:hypothetical protein
VIFANVVRGGVAGGSPGVRGVAVVGCIGCRGLCEQRAPRTCPAEGVELICVQAQFQGSRVRGGAAAVRFPILESEKVFHATGEVVQRVTKCTTAILGCEVCEELVTSTGAARV